MSGPAECAFEVHVLTTGVKLIDNLLNEKYPTKLERDLEILDQDDLSYRTYLAVTHRTA